MDRRQEMVQLATQLLMEQINPVRILSMSDEGGIPSGTFESNRQQFTFKFTRSGLVTYKPQRQGSAGREDSGLSDRLARLQDRLSSL
ncbi:MAG: hypothetical protein N3Z28_05260 [Synechococcaceae cyanobacterium MAG-AL2]|jgi:hypothetical protein|uniref:hypothetical protein n=1 Tax=Candidatus Regnicoccus frigidus TaxID=3074015 RepID=UPI0028174973|nr:hypothetical protein [Candidatus Regnicoccus frigidus]MCT4367063.1 hypothetical protein [Candidatus Regnicoccus frigidus MAG-AL2]